jgi:outer membrane cobalamin receptor
MRLVRAAFAVENLLDVFYEIRYNSPMPGRSFTISLEVKY